MNDPQLQTEPTLCPDCMGREWFIHFCDGEVDPMKCENCDEGFIEYSESYHNKQDEIETIQTQEI